MAVDTRADPRPAQAPESPPQRRSELGSVSSSTRFVSLGLTFRKHAHPTVRDPTTATLRARWHQCFHRSRRQSNSCPRCAPRCARRPRRSFSNDKARPSTRYPGPAIGYQPPLGGALGPYRPFSCGAAGKRSANSAARCTSTGARNAASSCSAESSLMTYCACMGFPNTGHGVGGSMATMPGP